MAMKEEMQMAEERLRLRHGGSQKWAKEMRRFKGRLGEGTEGREQYQEMMREKNALKDRQRRTNLAGKKEDEDSDYDSESDSDANSDQMRENAIEEI